MRYCMKLLPAFVRVSSIVAMAFLFPGTPAWAQSPLPCPIQGRTCDVGLADDVLTLDLVRSTGTTPIGPFTRGSGATARFRGIAVTAASRQKASISGMGMPAVTATVAVATRELTQQWAAVPFTPVAGSGGTAPLTYAVSPALPAGLSLSTGTGQIAGTPAEVSSSTTYTVTVTDALSQAASATFSLTVNPAVTATVAIATQTLSPHVAVTAFQPVTGSGGTGALSYAVNPALPAGLAFAAGEVTGTATGTSAATGYTVTVTDTLGATASASFSLAVVDEVSATVTVPVTALTQLRAAVPFTPVTGSGGTAPLTYAVSPALPAGLSLSTGTGQIAGTPATVSAPETYAVTIVDANGSSAAGAFVLSVSPALDAIAARADVSLATDTPANGLIPVSASGGVAPFTCAIEPSLPEGLDWSTATGAITGTPAGALAKTVYTVTITDANGATSSATFTLEITVPAQMTAVTVTASRATLLHRQQVTLTATVAPATATGTVTFLGDGVALGSSTLSGSVVTLVTSELAVGTHRIAARYDGDDRHAPSASADLVIEVGVRPDPAGDPTVRGLVFAQAAALAAFTDTQVQSVERRLEALHDRPAAATVPSAAAVLSQLFGPALTGAVQRRGTDPAGAPSGRTVAASAAAPPAGAPQTGAGNPDARVFLWTAGTLNFGDVSSDGRLERVRFTTSGLTIGIDGALRPNLKTGFALGYGRDRSEIGAHGSTSAAQNVAGTFYQSLRLGRGVFLDGLAGYGTARFRTRRWVGDASLFADGRRSASIAFGAISTAVERTHRQFHYAASGRLEVVRKKFDAFTEEAIDEWALGYSEVSTRSAAVVLGLRGQYDSARAWGLVSPLVRLEYRLRFAGELNQAIAYLADPTMVYALTHGGGTSHDVTVGLGVQFAARGGSGGAIEYAPRSSATLARGQVLRAGFHVRF